MTMTCTSRYRLYLRRGDEQGAREALSEITDDVRAIEPIDPEENRTFPALPVQWGSTMVLRREVAVRHEFRLVEPVDPWEGSPV